MRASTTTMTILMLLACSARAWNADEIDFEGDVQGWDLAAGVSTKYTGPDGSPEWFRFVTDSAAASGTYNFKMVAGNNWTLDQDYGGNTTFPKNATGTVQFRPADDTAAQLSGGSVAGKRYVFTAKNPGLSDTVISVMEITNPPVGIASVSGPTGAIATGTDLTFTVNLSAAPSPEEKVYIRATTDAFATSTIYPTTLAGSTATLTINDVSPGSVTWYAFTSTAAPATLAAANGFAIDALSLAWNNNSGANYSYTVSGPGEPVWMWHANNRVVQSTGPGLFRVQFWLKTGYIQGDGSGNFVNQARLYYTTDGVTAPTGNKGAPGLNTQVVTLSFDHIEDDNSPLGEAVWWAGALGGVAQGTTIRYRIGAWHDAFTQPERFADYGAGGSAEFTFTPGVTPGVPVLTVDGRNAEYTTTKAYLDERAGDGRPITVQFDLSGIANLDPASVEVFTNIGRRHLTDTDWDADGNPDGVKYPDFNNITQANCESPVPSYYRPHAMTPLGGNVFQWTNTVTQCGVYRVSARFKLNGDPTWRWYTERNAAGAIVFPEAQQLARAHCIVASPAKSLDMTLYEVNPTTVEATSNSFAGRSTFADMLGAPVDNDGFDPFNLDYLQRIHANCLWLQPIHPSGEDPRTSADGNDPGSPYSTKNYFAVAPYMGAGNSESSAMAEFTNLVVACDGFTNTLGTVNVMLDFVANHTSWDAVFGEGGQTLFGLSPSARIGSARPWWYSSAGNYCQAASTYTDEWNNNVAQSPDRGDFGKWPDAAELFYGRYASLVCLNPADNGNYLNEGDWFDFLNMTPGVIELWRYMGYYPEFWIRKTGHPGNNNDPVKDDLGVDAYRCDFGQGLPPQFWEYAVNRTRHVKWNTVFMAESLDGGVVGYRSNRHFDILNENFVFNFTQAKVNNSWDIRGALESRRAGYDGGIILLNLTGHDEVLPDNDAWLNASRYGALSAVEGLPMMFYGQEQGIQNYNTTPGFEYNDGFLTAHESNFGKFIPNFKQWNKLLVWEFPPPNSTGMADWYGNVNRARLNSPALRSPNRWFLNRTVDSGGGELGNLFAVAKYDEPGIGPQGGADVVLAFSLLLPHSGPHGTAAGTYDLRGAGDALWNQLGLHTGREYIARNLASSSPAAILQGWPRSGQSLYDDGVFVSLQGDNAQPITTDGALVQYLKLDAVPALVISDVARTGANVQVTIPVEAGWRYTILFSDDFRTAGATASWQPFVAQGVYAHIGAPGTHSFTDDFTPASSGVAFPAHGYRAYRLYAEPAP